MNEFNVLFVPVGISNFHMPSARDLFVRSCAQVRALCPEAVCPEEMLLDLEMLGNYLEGKQPDLVIFQNLTFANGAYAAQVARRFSCPLAVWSLREPALDGGRLRLNSLTGGFSAGNTFRKFGRRVQFLLGAPEEEAVTRILTTVIRAAKLVYDLRGLRMACIGHPPQGFGFGQAVENDLLRTFGVTLESFEARELMDAARACTDEEARDYLEKAGALMTGLDKLPEQNVMDFARLYKAYDDLIWEHGLGAVASRCWPDFFTVYGTPVCAVLSALNSRLVAAACEVDVFGALSMYMGIQLTGEPAFFGDPASIDEGENTITFWHCGAGACSLARADTGARVGVQCNRGIGPTMEFGCRPCEAVTVFRVGQDENGAFRFFLMRGRALDKPKQFNGASVVVQAEPDVRGLVSSAVKAGWEPHFAVIYGDVVRELTYVGEMLGLPTQYYDGRTCPGEPAGTTIG
ncbi:MAG: fucose isomerase [Lawsonibacter sp.]